MNTWQDRQAGDRGQEMLRHPSIGMSYVNYKGRNGHVNIAPIETFFGCNDWYSEPQWLLVARNTDRNVVREYALRDVMSWRCTHRWCSFSCWLHQQARMPNEINEVRTEWFVKCEAAAYEREISERRIRMSRQYGRRRGV